VDFIIENIRKYPGQVILFTVGPVTNIGKVIDKDPGVLKMTKHIYSMFGSFYSGYDMGPIPSAEWNVVADTPASQKFAACGAGLSYAGLDVTMKVRIDENNLKKLAMRHSPLTDALTGLYTLWGYQSYATPSPVIHDVLAIGMVLWPDLFSMRKAFVKVTDNGYTIIDESKEPNCEIAMTVNSDELIKRLMDRLLKQDLERN
jgi:inosine-uridine nucleoside N-ribohydrolase